MLKKVYYKNSQINYFSDHPFNEKGMDGIKRLIRERFPRDFLYRKSYLLQVSSKRDPNCELMAISGREKIKGEVIGLVCS